MVPHNPELVPALRTRHSKFESWSCPQCLVRWCLRGKLGVATDTFSDMSLECYLLICLSVFLLAFPIIYKSVARV